SVDSLPDLIELFPAGVEAGDFTLSGFQVLEEGRGIFGAGGVEIWRGESGFQLRDAGFGGVDGGFHAGEFALLVERQFARASGLCWRRRGGCWRTGNGDNGLFAARPFTFLAFFQVIRVI